MSDRVKELFAAAPMAANTSQYVTGHNIGGFLATVAGTLTVTMDPGVDGIPTVLVNAVPLTAGIYTPIPIMFNRPVTVLLAGGAAGTLMI